MSERLDLAAYILREYKRVTSEPVAVELRAPLEAVIICNDGSRHVVNGLFAQKLRVAAP